jgi:CspA family cold shock protein
MHGTVKMLNALKGWGFIRTEDGAEVFFHRSVVRGQPFEFLEERQAVDVELGEPHAGKGPRASEVRIL